MEKQGNGVLSPGEKREIRKRAFIDSVPVLMGYVTMGFAAGVLLAVHSGVRFPALWAMLTSGTSISGTLQFMIPEWLKSSEPLRHVAVLTVCINIRYAMYGLSLLEKFKLLKWYEKAYLIMGLTDETYALEMNHVGEETPAFRYYSLTLTALNHSYWVIGVTAGACAGMSLPFPTAGIDFAMTALFLVILTDQCRVKENRVPAAVGGAAALLSFLCFGAQKMLIPAIILMFATFILFRKKLEAHHE